MTASDVRLAYLHKLTALPPGQGLRSCCRCATLYFGVQNLGLWNRFCEKCDGARGQTLSFLKSRRLDIQIGGLSSAGLDIHEQRLVGLLVSSWYLTQIPLEGRGSTTGTKENDTLTFSGFTWMPSAALVKSTIIAKFLELFPELEIETDVDEGEPTKKPYTTTMLREYIASHPKK